MYKTKKHMKHMKHMKHTKRTKHTVAPMTLPYLPGDILEHIGTYLAHDPKGRRAVLHSCRMLRAEPGVHKWFTRLTVGLDQDQGRSDPRPLNNPDQDVLQGALRVFPKHAVLRSLSFESPCSVPHSIQSIQSAHGEVRRAVLGRFAHVRELRFLDASFDVFDDNYTGDRYWGDEERALFALGHTVRKIFPSVENLELKSSDPTVISYFPRAFLPRLVALKLVSEDTEEYVKGDVLVKLLRQNYGEDAPLSELRELSVKFDLDSVTLDDPSWFTVECVATSCPRLTYLSWSLTSRSFEYEPIVGVSGVQEVCERCPDLRILRIDDRKQICDSADSFRSQIAFPRFECATCDLTVDDETNFLPPMKVESYVAEELSVRIHDDSIIGSRRAVSTLTSNVRLVAYATNFCRINVVDPKQAYDTRDLLQRIVFVLGPLAGTAFAERIATLELFYEYAPDFPPDFEMCTLNALAQVFPRVEAAILLP